MSKYEGFTFIVHSYLHFLCICFLRGGLCKKCIQQLKLHLEKSKFLSISVTKIIQIIDLCTSHCFFKCNNIYQWQKFGLPMGSSLSGVLAGLFLEFLESKPFKYILPNDIHYFSYIDDILIIYSNKHNIPSITHRLSQIEPSLNFTYELKKTTILYLFWTSYK